MPKLQLCSAQSVCDAENVMLSNEACRLLTVVYTRIHRSVPKAAACMLQLRTGSWSWIHTEFKFKCLRLKSTRTQGVLLHVCVVCRSAVFLFQFLWCLNLIATNGIIVPYSHNESNSIHSSSELTMISCPVKADWISGFPPTMTTEQQVQLSLVAKCQNLNFRHRL